MQMNDELVDVNAPSDRQLKLKSVETQVRRKGDGELVMKLDELAAIGDRRAAIEGIRALMRSLND
ncbi:MULTISPECIES: hypothetical protein [Cupriavidus]